MTGTPPASPIPTEPPTALAVAGPVTPRRAWRWLVPLAAAGVVGMLASGVLTAGAKPNLAPQTAAQLLASVGTSRPAGFSGTVVEKASLGLPELPNLGGSSPSTGLMGLLSGSHTSRVWYGGQTKQRIALLDALGEQDVFRNGRDLWQYDSGTHVATHTVLPAGSATEPAPAVTGALTPAQAADRALKMVDPTTIVTTDRASVVAGRSAYTLVLTPRDTRSRVGSVRISVDGETRIPLGVQIIARGASKVALDVSFTRIKFSVPSDDFFRFSPPPDSVKPATPPIRPGTRLGAPDTTPSAPTAPSGPSGFTMIGTGWTTIAKATGVPSLGKLGNQSQDAGALLGALPTVSGSWGSGRLFQSALLTGLLTDDGRLFVGAVDPDLLYQAAGQK
jgi:outer membrane lipoprotein-sorting protein